MTIKSTYNMPQQPDYSGVTILELSPEPKLDDYLQATELANNEAEKSISENMLLAWYDRDRDFESPQHASECKLIVRYPVTSITRSTTAPHLKLISRTVSLYSSIYQ